MTIIKILAIIKSIRRNINQRKFITTPPDGVSLGASILEGILSSCYPKMYKIEGDNKEGLIRSAGKTKI